MRYSNIPDYADLIPIKDWVEAVQMGHFVPDDGVGYYATEDRMDRDAYAFSEPPHWATQVAWFNK